MNNASTPYFYLNQFRSLTLQFMAAFSWLHVKTGTDDEGNPEYASVPIHYGLKDRVAAAIIARQTQNTVLRLPSIAVYQTGEALAREAYSGYASELSNVHLPYGKSFPDGLVAQVYFKPTPYHVSYDLSIMTTNSDDMFQIQEQIMCMLDNYQLQLTTSDDAFKPGRLVEITLESIDNETQYPPGQERRALIKTFRFRALAFLQLPTQFRDEVINTVRMRIARVESFEKLPSTAEDFSSLVYDNEVISSYKADRNA